MVCIPLGERPRATQKPYVMGTLNKLKYKQAILYFASKIPLGEQGRVQLYKLLYFLDFNHYHKHQRTVTGDCYLRLDKGPAPSHISEVIREMGAEGLIRERDVPTAPGYAPRKVLETLRECDTSVFGRDELESLEAVIRDYGSLTGAQLTELSHKDPPYLLADYREQIDPEDTWYRYNRELDDAPDPITEALKEVNLAQLVEDRFGKGDE